MKNFIVEFKRVNGEEVKREFKVDRVLTAIEKYMIVRECLKKENDNCIKSNYIEGIATDIFLKNTKGTLILHDVLN